MPIDNTFAIIGKKFTVHILRNMTRLNQSRFNEFLDSIEGINPKTLSARLREMGKNGLIERKIYPGTPVKIEYSMTDKGKALTPILEQMAAFSMQYCAKDVFKDGKPRAFKQVFEKSPAIVK
ncbi:Transcriptional regulator, HxlR family [Candidatus Nitrosotalea sp. TS]|uniref:winged helix-turn-helix transcriptional regulator n=1 Tax=Candidatus Nitrosotalea sp. TS TaxID=2341020 RepID=UPI001ECBC85E|nr:helix-turn-helix domain-containing protein [Candidatus Nitrosotalea sp. TS]NHI02524.1 Transcriptional regulator, HxlR family [Candidatus Nitrosotalea sp. TS]